MTTATVDPTTIICPKCFKELYRFKRIPEPGDRLNSKDFEPASSDVPRPEYGQPCICPFCGAWWFSWFGGGRALTDIGVWPKPLTD